MELIPRKEPQKITYQQYQDYTPEKIEMYENNLFFTDKERMDMLLLLMTNVGLESMVEALPLETKIALKKMFNEETEGK